LRHDLAGGAVTLEFDEYERTIGCDRQEVYASTKAGVFLLSDKHPLIREQAWCGDDHVLQQLLIGERRLDQRLRLATDLPESGSDGQDAFPSSGT
jgi:hypothetical protein